MELVDGEELAERLERGPIPVDEALAVARQIAEALEEAHEKGIVLRDLKPANVKLTPVGKAKVLDFGLAKAYAGDLASGSGPDERLPFEGPHAYDSLALYSNFLSGAPAHRGQRRRSTSYTRQIGSAQRRLRAAR